MTFNVQVTIDLEVEVDGEIPAGRDITGEIQNGICEAIPSVIHEEEDVFILFANNISVKVGRMKWNTK